MKGEVTEQIKNSPIFRRAVEVLYRNIARDYEEKVTVPEDFTKAFDQVVEHTTIAVFNDQSSIDASAEDKKIRKQIATSAGNIFSSLEGNEAFTEKLSSATNSIMDFCQEDKEIVLGLAKGSIAKIVNIAIQIVIAKRVGLNEDILIASPEEIEHMQNEKVKLAKKLGVNVMTNKKGEN
ncbi:MAG: phage tail tape measure C-terminal domain-containing protein [Parcubacteria group bacterium]